MTAFLNSVADEPQRQDAFAPRKQTLAVYLTPGPDHSRGQLEQLGKRKTGKGCLYLKRLDDVRLPTWKASVRESVRAARRQQA